MGRRASQDFVLKKDDDLSGVYECGQMALKLRFEQKLKYAQIAGTLQLPIGTIKSQIHRAKARVLANRAAKAAGVVDPPNNVVPASVHN